VNSSGLASAGQSEDESTAPSLVRAYVSLHRRQYGVFLDGTLLTIIPPAILFFALQEAFRERLSASPVEG